MSLLRWMTKNWANTTEPTHADLKPLFLSGDLAAVQERLSQIVGKLPRWSVLAADQPGKLHLTRRTRTIRFVDDIWLTLTPTESGIRIDAESRSRLGKGDLGQNRRNILEIFREIQTQAG